MVQQPARGCDQHVDALVDDLVLVLKAGTTDQQRFGKLGIFGIGIEVLSHLCGQFPGGGQHQ